MVYSNPHIILLSYPLESMWDDQLTPNQTTYYFQYMTSLYNKAQMQGMSNVQLLQLNGVNLSLDNWCVGHPSVAAYQNFADQLAKYVTAVLPAWVIATFPVVEPE